MVRTAIILLAFLFMGFGDVYAVRAYPQPVTVQQSDGTSVTIVGHGDEDFNYVTTIDGVLLVKEGHSWMVAEVGIDGELQSSGVLAHDNGQRSTAELAAISRQDREAYSRRSEETRHMNKVRREPVAASSKDFPHVGNPKAVVILAEFSDVKFSLPDPQHSFNQYLNSMSTLQDLGNGEHSNACSIRNYFDEISFGQFAPDFDVYGPVELPNPLKTYGGEKAGGKDEKMNLLFQDACSLLDERIDFSQYDANADGLVDLVGIIYAGYSESMTGNSAECIWPKSGNMSGGTYDGKRVSRYLVSAELNGFPGCFSSAPFKRINGIGTFCHELSHCLGLPDFYPTVASIKGDNQGMEYWSLMDSGNYLSNGYSPCAYTAWEREAMGWITIPTLDDSAGLSQIELKPIDNGGTAYRILNDCDATGREYLIVEDIQKIGINSQVKGHGMLVYHVNYDPDLFSLSRNAPNNVKGSPCMTVVPADNLLFAMYNVGKVIDGKTIRNTDFYAQLAGDPFPGTSNQTECSDETGLVNFAPYTGEVWNKALQSITEHKDGSITFTYIANITEDIKAATNDDADDQGFVYNINGQRVAKDYRGMVIRKGRKYVNGRP